MPSYQSGLAFLLTPVHLFQPSPASPASPFPSSPILSPPSFASSSSLAPSSFLTRSLWFHSKSSSFHTRIPIPISSFRWIKPFPLTCPRSITPATLFSSPLYSSFSFSLIRVRSPLNMSQNLNSSDPDDKEFIELIAQFRAGVSIKDRKYRLKTYKNCFVGSEAVDWFIKYGHAKDVEDAVKIGEYMEQANVFKHVLREHPFQNDMLYYRFVEDFEHGANKKKDDGTNIKWADFLSPVATDKATSFQPSISRSSCTLLPEVTMDPLSTTVVTALCPLDEHNLKLLDNVHPPQWSDPIPKAKYDIVVIGAGAGGLVTAAGCAGLGAKVALIEKHMLGGDCLNFGCVPSKALLNAAKMVAEIKDTVKLKDLGIEIEGSIKVNFAQVMKRMRKIRADISPNDSAERFSKNLGVDVFIGEAQFLSSRSVLVNGKTLNFRKCCIATGAYPSIPDIPSLEDLARKYSAGTSRGAILTNENIFNLTELPKSLGVIGSGPIGIELAQAFQRLGSAVTVFGRSERILPKEDLDLANIVMEKTIKDGINYVLDVQSYCDVQVEEHDSSALYPKISLKVINKDQIMAVTHEFDALLIATGRKPSVKNLALEIAGVEYNNTSGIIVNDMLETSKPGIFAVGDVCSAYQFTHVADFMARIVIRNSLFFGKEKMSSLIIPWCTYTDPELAHVGLYVSDIEAAGFEYVTYEKRFCSNDRAICEGETDGLVRIHVRSNTDTILGASIVGPYAGDLISEITMAMNNNIGLGKFASVIHPYPTRADAIRACGDLRNKERLTNVVKMFLRQMLKVQR